MTVAAEVTNCLDQSAALEIPSGYAEKSITNLCPKAAKFMLEDFPVNHLVCRH